VVWRRDPPCERPRRSSKLSSGTTILRCAGLYVDPFEEVLFEEVSGAGMSCASSSVPSDSLSTSTLMTSSVSVTLGVFDSAGGIAFSGLCGTLLRMVCGWSSSSGVVEFVRSPFDSWSLFNEGDSESTYCRVSDARSRNSSAVSVLEMTGTVLSVERTGSALSDRGNAARLC